MQDIKKVKISNPWSVPNQFIIETPDGTFFQSYNSIIAFIPANTNLWQKETGQADKIRLDANTWDYSTTTGKYRNKFLGESINETRRKIKAGEYILTNLN